MVFNGIVACMAAVSQSARHLVDGVAGPTCALPGVQTSPNHRLVYSTCPADVEFIELLRICPSKKTASKVAGPLGWACHSYRYGGGLVGTAHPSTNTYSICGAGGA